MVSDNNKKGKKNTCQLQTRGDKSSRGVHKLAEQRLIRNGNEERENGTRTRYEHDSKQGGKRTRRPRTKEEKEEKNEI